MLNNVFNKHNDTDWERDTGRTLGDLIPSFTGIGESEKQVQAWVESFRIIKENIHIKITTFQGERNTNLHQSWF